MHHILIKHTCHIWEKECESLLLLVAMGNLVFRRLSVGFVLPCEFVHFVSLAWTCVDGL